MKFKKSFKQDNFIDLLRQSVHVDWGKLISNVDNWELPTFPNVWSNFAVLLSKQGCKYTVPVITTKDIWRGSKLHRQISTLK